MTYTDTYTADDRPITVHDWRQVIDRRRPLGMTIEDVAHAILHPNASRDELPSSTHATNPRPELTFVDRWEVRQWVQMVYEPGNHLPPGTYRVTPEESRR